MATPPRADARSNHDWTLAAFGLFVIVVVVSLFMRVTVIQWVTTGLYVLWSFADFPRIHPYVGQRLNLLASIHNQATLVSWSDFSRALNLTAGILLVVMVPLAIIGIISVRLHPAARTRRPLNVRTLPRIMANMSPAIIPALQYGDPKTQLLNTDPPEHRSAQAPDEFAIEHKLVVNRRLNRERAEHLFVSQLGPRLSTERLPVPAVPVLVPEAGLLGHILWRLRCWQHRQKESSPLRPQFEQFRDYERALFAVFGLQFFLDKRKEAERLLDNLNRSTRNRKTPGYPDLRLAARAFCLVARSPEALAWIQRYGYARTAIAALHNNDLHLPGARFRWLKGLDRTLWYALSSTGRPFPFVEGAGVVSQAHWETLAAQYQVRLTRPVMALALDGLETDLITLGAVVNPTPRQPSQLDDEDDEEEEEEIRLPVPAHSPITPATTAPEETPPAPQQVNTWRPRMKMR